jgi:hypothetical protein
MPTSRPSVKISRSGSMPRREPQHRLVVPQRSDGPVGVWAAVSLCRHHLEAADQFADRGHEVSSWPTVRLLSTFHNRKAFGFTVSLPLVIFYACGTTNRNALTDGRISFALYFMTGIAAYGALFAIVSPGAHRLGPL